LLREKILGLLLITCFFLSFDVIPSFGLTESVELFGEVNSIDLILNDIWMEPENPKDGEPISIHGSVYNAGIIPSGDFSDAVTVAYFVNGELAEIDVLKNILPGLENGLVVSSGPIFDAIPGNYVVTMIINYHDTLSHLRDNLENNIVQKKFQIASDDVPSLINYDIYQNYDENLNRQQISLQGDLTNIFQKKTENRDVIIDVGDHRTNIITDADGHFFLETAIDFDDKPVTVTAFLEEDSTVSSLSKTIFPLKLKNNQSALALKMVQEINSNHFKNPVFTVALFQDSYDNLFKKISTDDVDDQSMLIDNFFLTVLPANHEYIAEIYLEGRFIGAIQSNFTSNAVVDKEIFISDSAQIKFRVVDETNSPQSDVYVENWIFSANSGNDGFTDWIPVIPTVIDSEPYVAKAIFSNGIISWSDPFFIESGEKKVIEIIRGDDK
jgi:hypothetical protein